MDLTHLKFQLKRSTEEGQSIIYSLDSKFAQLRDVRVAYNPNESDYWVVT